jgi:FMN phosphatase YigB (HAD superfamily)
VCSNLGHGYGRKVVELVPGARGYAMSYEVGAFKPDPRMYAAVADILDAPPSRIFFVGDTRKADYDGPIEFGLRAAHLDRSSGDDLLSVVRRALSDATDNPILNK